jgi:hypothetical protein
MSKDLNVWLAEAPTAAEIENQIEALERKLELLRAIKRLQTPGSSGAVAAAPVATPAAKANGNEHHNGNGNGKARAAAAPASQRLSPERVAIINAIRMYPRHEAGIRETTRALARMGAESNEKRVSQNMGRMTKKGLLSRVGYGRYTVTSVAAELVREIEDREAERLNR